MAYRYSLECDHCGAIEQGQHVDKPRARLVATKLGWLVCKRHGHLCPKCAEPAFAEIDAQEKAKAEKANEKALRKADRKRLSRERQEIAFLMAGKGATFKEIATELGVREDSARGIYQRERRAWMRHLAEISRSH